jgi:hypothetical protein
MLANAIAFTAIGFALGGLLAVFAPIVLDVMLERYDQLNPVIDANVYVVEHNADDILVHMDGEKKRTCIYVGLNAYVPQKNGKPGSRVYLRRVDTPETGETRPQGPLDMGLWRIWPTAGAKRVELYAQHVCSGRIVTTKMADIDLTQKRG